MDFSKTWSESKTREERKAEEAKLPAVPDGRYTATMMNAKHIIGKASGKPMMLVELMVIGETEYKGQKLVKFYMFDEMGMGNLKTDLEIMGRTIPDPTSEESVVESVYDLLPLTVSIATQSKLDKNGIMRTNVYINGPAEDVGDDEQIPF